MANIMQPRHLLEHLLKTATYYPVVLVDGPRQSGKTTLCRGAFPDKKYVSLEAIDNREFAQTDPRGFLSEYGDGAIIDEVQHVPDLLSYIQDNVDENPKAGRFILSGSQNLAISGMIFQSLAGRAGILHLLPLSRDEVAGFGAAPSQLYELLWTGGYPRIYDRGIPAQQWLADYVATYIQRDVRQLVNITDLSQFTNFFKLCAAHTSQELNLSKLGAAAGVSYNTINAWLSVLEASFLCFRLPAWHRNVKKQVVKAPKLHFFDSGIVCYLLGIKDPSQLRFHPLRGAIFESWVVAERYKAAVHRGLAPNFFHYRETRGAEVDLVQIDGDHIILTEMKSGETIDKQFFNNLHKLEQSLSLNTEDSTSNSVRVEKQLIYGGRTASVRQGVNVIPWVEV